MKEYGIAIGIVVVTLVIGFWVVDTRAPDVPACTKEAKICMDGSVVGRTGPNCEFAACPTASTTGNGGVLPYTTGVRGTVSLGPTCPVMRIPPDPQCADKPYAVAITVYRAGSRTPFIVGSSNVNGAFELPLPPGSYTLSAGSGTTLPHCAEVEVTVAARGYVSTTISCDTGIR